MSSTDNNGLGLFDDTASAVGNFPTALRGYDRTAVDDYVRTLEASVVQSRRRAAQLEQQVNGLTEQVSDTGTKPSAPADADFADLGGRANDILRLAQEQARDLVENATVEAQRISEQARREADGLRSNAAREGNAIKSGGVAEVDQLRQRLHDEVQAQVDKSKADADALLAAARRESEARRRQADHDAQATRQAAFLDSENLRRTVEREVAETRSQLATDREQTIAHLKAMYDEANEKTAALLSEATAHHSESTTRLEADIAAAAKIRSEAAAEAEQLKLSALAEAEARVSTAKKQAAAIGERTQQEFSWRKDQLRRETELLQQRKQAVLSQLASLSALAQQTAQAFPDLEDPSDLDPAGSSSFGDAGESDRTILRPTPEGGSENTGSEDTVRSDPREAPQAQAGPIAGTESAPDGTEGDTDTTVIKPAATGQQAGTSEEPPMDGDATILVAPSDMPAGTEHLGNKRQ